MMHTSSKKTFLVAAALAAGTAVGLSYVRKHIDRRWPLRPALDASRRTILNARAGCVSCYEDTSGSGTPVLLLHSINAAASAYEMRPLFEALRGERPVFAPDLPGFGLSE